MERRVDETDRDRQAVHLAQDLGEVLALQRQQLGQCRLPGGFVGGKDQPLDQLAPRAEEHVLGPAQARPRRRRTDGRARRPPRYRRWPAPPCGVPGRRGPSRRPPPPQGRRSPPQPTVPSRCRSTGESVTGTAPRNTSPVVPSIETTSPSRMVRPATRTSLRATSMSSCSAPHTQVRPIPRATTAACEVLPPRAVSTPRAAIMPGRSSGLVSRRTSTTSSPRAPHVAALSDVSAMRPEVAPGEAPTPVVRCSRGAVWSNRGNSSCASWSPVTRRTASSASISPSSTMARAIRNAASGVRFPTRVCRIHRRPLSMVNSMSHRSR